MTNFVQLLEKAGNFELRRTVERLREGLFDPFAVRLLTVHEGRLDNVFDHGVQALKKDKPAHLCLCGAYGQGKSHSLAYIRQRALEQGFVVSRINLDPGEIPFHAFQRVYHALVSQISFPDNESSLANWWIDRVNEQKKNWKNDGTGPLDLIPDSMPLFFKAVLVALAQDNMELSNRQRGLKKHTAFRPREFPWLLANALNGDALPVFRLRHAMRYRQVSFFKDASLVCKGWEPYFEAICALAAMFRKMGLKGWVLLFDEGESIGQLRVDLRRKCYRILNRFFFPASRLPGLYPIFAFTEDFFMRVRAEDYNRVYVRKEQELRYFEENYADAWRNLNIYRLQDLSAEEWEILAEKLLYSYAKAYEWNPPETKIRREMAVSLAETGDRETRLRIKALVNQLDLAHQKIVLGV
jgi:hypothetical protein